MALIALLNGPHHALQRGVRPFGLRHGVLCAPSEDGLLRLVRQRPVSAALLDLEGMAPVGAGLSLLDKLRHDFPNLPVIVGIEARPDPRRLLQLGRHREVAVLVGPEVQAPQVLDKVIERRLRRGPRRIPIWLGQALGPWPGLAVAQAINAVDHCWSADDFADSMNLGRLAFSRRLSRVGLPTPGRLLTWMRILYAAWWLPEPGRTGGSVASQLEYASSQGLVRAIRTVLGVTPREMIARGGFDWAWIRFLKSHPGLLSKRPARASVPSIGPPASSSAGVHAIL